MVLPVTAHGVLNAHPVRLREELLVAYLNDPFRQPADA